jgi:hypothetical protein
VAPLNVASGAVQPDGRWPSPPLAIPRGPREQTWHALLLLSFVLTVTVPWLRILVPVWAGVLLSVRLGRGHLPSASALQRITGPVVLITTGLLTHHIGGAQLGDMVVLFIRRELPPVRELLGPAAYTGLVLHSNATAGLILSTLLRFDIRTVRRDIVDERVWARQQHRRRQVMTAHHHRQPPPVTA